MTALAEFAKRILGLDKGARRPTPQGRGRSRFATRAGRTQPGTWHRRRASVVTARRQVDPTVLWGVAACETMAQAIFAASCALAGRTADARRAMAKLRQLDPALHLCSRLLIGHCSGSPQLMCEIQWRL